MSRATADAAMPDYYIFKSATSTIDYVSWGTTGDIALSEDFDGDDKPDREGTSPKARFTYEGRGNYLSKRRLEVASERAFSLLTWQGWGGHVTVHSGSCRQARPTSRNGVACAGSPGWRRG